MGHQKFTVKDFRTASGVVLDLTLAYATFGDPALPAVLHPTCTSPPRLDLLALQTVPCGSV